MATELKTDDILREKNTDDPNSIISLTINHKPISHASCLSAFKNLQTLDLKSNALTSLKGVESCFSLKSLCVQQNKLRSLKGIEALSNLTVLNAGKNKLTSMGEVKTLLKLRALILNDNEIESISGLDQLLELNTLVLSRNPIRKMGSSLVKLKSITKISLSNCQLEDIDNSIKACAGLRELRLAHNDIKTLPLEFAYCKKLLILDLGNNMISKWSDLEVLSSLNNVRNLNLLGNPISEKVKFIKKVKKLVPRLQTLNSKSIDNLSSEKDQRVEDALVGEGDEFKPSENKNSVDIDFGEHVNRLKLSKDHKLAKDTGICGHMKEKNSRKAKTCHITEGEPDDGENEQKKQKKKVKQLENLEQEAENEQKKQEEKLLKSQKQESDGVIKDKRYKRKIERAHLDAIDDKETSFVELVSFDTADNMKLDAISALVTYPSKKKKSKNQGAGDSLLQFPTLEIGLGGPSAWTDVEE